MARSKGTKLPGDPEGPAWLPVTSPLVPSWDDLAPRLQAILERRWLTNQGEAARDLEEELRGALGAPHAHLVTNGTLALEVLIRAAIPSGEVLVPAFSFPATWNMLLDDPRYRVRFVDVGEDGNLDPDAAAAAIGPETRAILGVHAYGRPCHPERLATIAREHDLTLLFDAAHAFGVFWDGAPVGSLGHGSAWSFHATKVFNTLEGGAVSTSDASLAE
ncbi:MAG: DegT/DnrJ/EryC1/StrS family aminotransferase, partial [Myxococcota bacterium]|nr:DegT/DnrJ/EryC1/StrS family aminotransferase [Myxococcota bacterium]